MLASLLSSKGTIVPGKLGSWIFRANNTEETGKKWGGGGRGRRPALEAAGDCRDNGEAAPGPHPGAGDASIGEGPGVQVRSAQGRVRPEDAHYPSLWLPCGLLPCSASSVVSAGLSLVSVASEGALTSPPRGRHTLCPHSPPDTPGALTWALCFPAAWHHVLALYSLEPD